MNFLKNTPTSTDRGTKYKNMKTYNTEILSVGTELLLGHVTNTDARDVSEMLSEIGINVLYHTVVGDNPARLRKCIEIARARADIIVATGGLGPTCDDLTKQTLADAFGMELVLNEDEFRCLYDYISARHEYTENNTQQAMLPKGCTVFHNSCGTAPGCAFEKDGTLVIMLPGPPKECRAMMKESVIPFLRDYSDQIIVSHTVRVFGLGESAVDDILADEMNAMTNPSMAPYAKECDCLVKITAKADSRENAEKMISPVVEHVTEKLGEFVYGIDVESIEEEVNRLLKDSDISFSVGESSTGGSIAERYTVFPDCFSNFYGGIIKPYPPSAESAAILAEEARKTTGADIGIGIAGNAGPEDEGGLESGTFFICLCGEKIRINKELVLGNFRTRSFNRQMAGNHVYDLLRREIIRRNQERASF